MTMITVLTIIIRIIVAVFNTNVTGRPINKMFIEAYTGVLISDTFF
jgi:hypothetical protein